VGMLFLDLVFLGLGWTLQIEMWIAGWDVRRWVRSHVVEVGGNV